MTDLLCVAVGCRHEQAPGILLCDTDARRLGDWLARLGDEYDRLTAVPSMQGREPGAGSSTGSLASERSVGDLTVMELRDTRLYYGRPGEHAGAFAVLNYWASGVRAMRGFSSPRDERPSVATERAVLAKNLDWIMAHPSAGKFYAAIQSLWQRVHGKNDPQPRTTKRVCPCGGRISWVDGAAECDRCHTRITGLDVIRQEQTT